MGMINKESGADCGQSPVGGVEEGIGGLVVLRAYPLALENAPQRLDDVRWARVFPLGVSLYAYILRQC